MLKEENKRHKEIFSLKLKMNTITESTKTAIRVDFSTFVQMTHLQVNCLYNTVNLVNKKIDYLYGGLGKEFIDISKIRDINEEMDKLQKECTDKFEKMKKSCEVIS